MRPQRRSGYHDGKEGVARFTHELGMMARRAPKSAPGVTKCFELTRRREGAKTTSPGDVVNGDNLTNNGEFGNVNLPGVSQPRFTACENAGLRVNRCALRQPVSFHLSPAFDVRTPKRRSVG